MTVIVANNVPPAIRGLLKRWFVEPRPNVFVGTVNQRTREKTLQYIIRNAPPDLNLLVIASNKSSQGFQIQSVGGTNRRPVAISGLQLILEAWEPPPPTDGSAPSVPAPTAGSPPPAIATTVSTPNYIQSILDDATVTYTIKGLPQA